MKNKISPKKILANFDFAVTGMAMSVLVIITFIGVITRYVFNNPLVWMEEVQLICIVWVVYGAAGMAFRLRTHVAIEILVDLFPQKVQKVIQVFASIVIVTTVVFLFIRSIGYVELFVMSGRVSSILRIPYRLVYTIIPVSCVLMVGNYLFSLFFSQGRREQEEQKT